ncbi:amidohydrolase family protein [Rhizobium lusitanum]|uniref:Amidohydrolase family protein n=1 Tax=Rhizobium lusitanum TaxID=293958 RepID=A0A6L9UAS2_9HYPH|nr:amidohydrolase [Rhizobium lusitanum]NEI71608.1 amidohydrolase family protein [Rhizobium lusitanum]
MQASIVIRNARVLTMDETQPHADAVAISGNRILAVGSDVDVARFVGPQTRRIDAGGATVLPGFNESHLHIFSGSVALNTLSLFGVRGFDNLRTALLRFAAERPDSKLLIGKSAEYTLVSETRNMTRHDLDAIIPDRPVILVAPDHHTGWANTLALKMAGLLEGRDVGVGNEVVMAKDGLAHGELREINAMGPVFALGDTGGREGLGFETGGEPAHVTATERVADIAVLRQGLAYCASLGITSIQNMDGNLYQLELMDEIEQTDGLPVRVRIPFHMKSFMPLSDLEAKAAVWRDRYASDKLRCDFVKMFMDGVAQSGTAVFVDDYANRPGWKGEPLFTQDHFNEIAANADRLGLSIAVHAIGDGAVRMVLDGYEAAAAANGPRDRRNRIEHAEVVHPDDLPRFGRLGVVASMQPTHPPGSAGTPLEPYVSCVGEARWQYCFPWRRLVDTGASIVFGTDWPVSPLAPISCIYDAMNRKVWRDDLPDHRLTLAETLAAYTRTSAWLEYMEDRKGILREGYLADLVMLSGDIEAIGLDKLDTLRPVLTLCDGRVTYEA